MEDATLCASISCKVCYAKYLRKVGAEDGAKLYARPTSASLRRHIASEQSSTAYKTPPVLKETALSKFELLPAEIRLQIYRECLISTRSPIAIAGWRKGGGRHIGSGVGHIRTNFFASSRFHVPLLLLNKRIYGEVLPEIYQQIDVRLHQGTVTVLTRPQMEYWFTRHPFRFTSQLSMTLAIVSSPSTSIHRRDPWGWIIPKLEQWRQFVQIWSRMPTLRDVKITLELYQDHRKSPLVFMEYNNALWRRKLKLLREVLPAAVRISISIKFSHGICDVSLRFEQTEMNTIYDAMKEHLRADFEVDLLPMRVGDIGGNSNPWILQWGIVT
jgi:hypothetical protein